MKNRTKFEFEIRNTSEHEVSRTLDVIYILSSKPDFDFCHFFYYCPIPTREFFLYRKKKCFFSLKTGKCLDAYYSSLVMAGIFSW